MNLPTDDISKWDITGLTETFEGNAKYILAKLLNNQSAVLTQTVKNKYLSPDSFEVQIMLPIVSRVMKGLPDTSKIEVVNGSAQFQDNPDIMIVPRVHSLTTPARPPHVVDGMEPYSSLSEEAEYCGVIADEIIALYKNILEDETVTTLYLNHIFLVQYGTDITGIKPVGYSTQYSIYREQQ